MLLSPPRRAGEPRSGRTKSGGGSPQTLARLAATSGRREASGSAYPQGNVPICASVFPAPWRSFRINAQSWSSALQGPEQTFWRLSGRRQELAAHQAQSAEVVFLCPRVRRAGPPLFMVEVAEVALALRRCVEVAQGDVQADPDFAQAGRIEFARCHLDAWIESDSPFDEVAVATRL